MDTVSSGPKIFNINTYDDGDITPEPFDINWRIYIRANDFKYENKDDFLNKIELTNEFKEKTVREITNCYDSDPERGEIKTKLKTDEYKGIFPTYNLSMYEDIRYLNNIRQVFLPGHGRTTGIESLLIFFSPKDSVKSSETGERGDERFERESIKELIRINEDNYNGIIETNCRAILLGNYVRTGDETIITPDPDYFKGLILYYEKDATSDDIISEIMNCLTGKEKIYAKAHQKQTYTRLRSFLEELTIKTFCYDEHPFCSSNINSPSDCTEELESKCRLTCSEICKPLLGEHEAKRAQKAAEEAAEREAAEKAAAEKAQTEGGGKKTRKKKNKSKRKKKNKTKRKNKKNNRVKKLTRKSK